MKKVCLVLLVLLVAGGVWAYQPAGWLYFQWPYAYDLNQNAWYYFNEPCSQWCIGLPSGAWQYLSQGGAGSGWNYYQWPYCYSIMTGGWFYMDVNSVQLCVKLNNGRWSQFGQVMDYMVIDLSGGPGAASYPVSYLFVAPTNGWTDEYKTGKLVLGRIPAGTFTMGLPSSVNPWYIPHQVTLTKDFYIGVFEVTQKQWERVMGTWPSWFTNAAYRESRPVEQVRYGDVRGEVEGAWWPANGNVDADSFMGRLRTKTGLSFDLPTESQWEYACRAGTATDLNTGYNVTNMHSDTRMDQAGRYWFNGGSGAADRNDGIAAGSAKVGSYLANAWGLYDMHGNVHEWCLDWYSQYPAGAVEDPKGPASATDRVQRSGCAGKETDPCRSSSRNSLWPYPPVILYQGFRLAWTLP